MADILQIGKDAQESKRHFPDTIDASIGMFYDENHVVGGFPSVYRVLKSLAPELMLPYNSVDGGTEFKQNVSSWLLGRYEKLIWDTMHPFVCSTPGGSGVVSAVFASYGREKEAILVPNIRWQYGRFAKPRALTLETYTMFEGSAFNLKDFEFKLTKLAAHQKRIIVVINDPCHNPSGYTLQLSEWLAIIDLLNRFSDHEIVLLYDVAYIDYSLEKDARLKISYLPTLGKHVVTVMAFSGSKTFGAYGLRLGAAISLSVDEKKAMECQQKLYGYACGTWSSSATPSIELMMRKENKPEFLADLAKAKDTISQRGVIFKKQAADIQLKTAPYVNGFYSFVLCDKSEEVYAKLAEHHIFVVPMEGGIRVALCSLSLKEVDGLAAKIKTIASL
ncbi:MAG: aminotransferase class I/II-fold pyridoxal phosphate-dependent enzyme [Firmicutes bacterium]|nr:aminotransferase class I/II-fold pyridoxal phosphate-dependent enzyme [Bacillota bacterium]